MERQQQQQQQQQYDQTCLNQRGFGHSGGRYNEATEDRRYRGRSSGGRRSRSRDRRRSRSRSREDRYRRRRSPSFPDQMSMHDDYEQGGDYRDNRPSQQYHRDSRRDRGDSKRYSERHYSPNDSYNSRQQQHHQQQQPSQPSQPYPQHNHQHHHHNDSYSRHNSNNSNSNNSQNNGNYRYNDYDDDYDSLDSDTGGRYTSQVPSYKIKVRGLAQHITEADISSDLIQYGLKPVAIRLVRKRKTGASRGFAFVEFSTEEEATRWMDYKQGTLMLQDQYRAVMEYCCERSPLPMSTVRDKTVNDWYCAKCLVFNFKRRENCFKCFASREESERGGEGSDEISPVLTKKIMLRNLDVLTNEEGVLTAMQSIIPDLAAKIAKILVCRDSLTNTSRGICYLTFDNLVDSMNAHNALKSVEPCLNIESREVAVSYCVDAEEKPRQQLQHPVKSNPKLANVGQQSAMDMYGGNNAADQPEQYNKYYSQYYANSRQTVETANSGAAVAQSAMQRKNQQGRHGNENAAIGPVAPNQQPIVAPKGSDGKKYPIPDVTKFQYDETSGYYYDPVTTLYYDPHSQYYYNSETTKYMYWDGEQSTYILAPATKPVATTSPSSAATVAATVELQAPPPPSMQPDNPPGRKSSADNKPDKVKVAKQIVKDMERWAKQLNQKKDSIGGAMQLPVTAKEEHPLQRQQLQSASAAATNGYADVGFSILEKKESISKRSEESPALPKMPSIVTSSALASNKLVAAYGSDSDNEDGGLDERRGTAASEKDYVDFEKLTCLLCKRAFQSQEILSKHLKMSTLHKENLQKYNLTHGILEMGANSAQSYRDRAKERRLKYGEADPPPVSKGKERFQKDLDKTIAPSSAVLSASISMAAPIGESNMGNKLLQKMGWQAGQGLGRSNQGRTKIIEVESRAGHNAGLGTKGAALPFTGGDYKTYIKNMMRSRYEQMEDDN